MAKLAGHVRIGEVAGNNEDTKWYKIRYYKIHIKEYIFYILYYMFYQVIIVTCGTELIQTTYILWQTHVQSYIWQQQKNVDP